MHLMKTAKLEINPLSRPSVRLTGNDRTVQMYEGVGMATQTKPKRMWAQRRPVQWRSALSTDERHMKLLDEICSDGFCFWFFLETSHLELMVIIPVKHTLKTADSGSNTVGFFSIFLSIADFCCGVWCERLHMNLSDVTVKVVWMEGRGVRLEMMDSRRRLPSLCETPWPRSVHGGILQYLMWIQGLQVQSQRPFDPSLTRIRPWGVRGLSGGVSVRVNMSTCPFTSPSENTHHFIPV